MPPSCITVIPGTSPSSIAMLTAGVTTLSRPLGVRFSANMAIVEPEEMITDSLSPTSETALCAILRFSAKWCRRLVLRLMSSTGAELVSALP